MKAKTPKTVVNQGSQRPEFRNQKAPFAKAGGPKDGRVSKPFQKKFPERKFSKVTLFLRGLSKETTVQKLQKLCEKCGVPPKEIRPSFQKGIAYIEFETPDKASKVKEDLSGAGMAVDYAFERTEFEKSPGGSGNKPQQQGKKQGDGPAGIFPNPKRSMPLLEGEEVLRSCNMERVAQRQKRQLVVIMNEAGATKETIKSISSQILSARPLVEWRHKNKGKDDPPQPPKFVLDFVDEDTAEQQKLALEKKAKKYGISKVEYTGEKSGHPRKPPSAHPTSLILRVEDLPEGTSEKDIKELLPEAKSVHFENGPNYFIALAYFGSPYTSLLAFARSESVLIKGRPVLVLFGQKKDAPKVVPGAEKRKANNAAGSPESKKQKLKEEKGPENGIAETKGGKKKLEKAMAAEEEEDSSDEEEESDEDSSDEKTPGKLKKGGSSGFKMIEWEDVDDSEEDSDLEDLEEEEESEEEEKTKKGKKSMQDKTPLKGKNTPATTPSKKAEVAPAAKTTPKSGKKQLQLDQKTPAGKDKKGAEPEAGPSSGKKLPKSVAESLKKKLGLDEELDDDTDEDDDDFSLSGDEEEGSSDDDEEGGDSDEDDDDDDAGLGGLADLDNIDDDDDSDDD